MLGRLCTTFGWTLSRLMAEAETRTPSFVPAAQQATWTDPETGYRRRIVSPPAPGLRGELVEIRVPAGATVAYDASPVPGLEHHLWLLDGALTLDVDGNAFQLRPRRRAALRPERPVTLHGHRPPRGPLRDRPGAPMTARRLGDDRERRSTSGGPTRATRRPSTARSTCSPRCSTPSSTAAPASASSSPSRSRTHARSGRTSVLPGVIARRRRVLVARLDGPDRGHRPARSGVGAEPAAPRRSAEAARAPGRPPPRHRARADGGARRPGPRQRLDPADARHVDGRGGRAALSLARLHRRRRHSALRARIDDHDRSSPPPSCTRSFCKFQTPSSKLQIPRSKNPFGFRSSRLKRAAT